MMMTKMTMIQWMMTKMMMREVDWLENPGGSFDRESEAILMPVDQEEKMQRITRERKRQSRECGGQLR